MTYFSFGNFNFEILASWNRYPFRILQSIQAYFLSLFISNFEAYTSFSLADDRLKIDQGVFRL